MTQNYARLGSVSSGTMRPEDLIPAFLDVLGDLDRGQADAIAEEYHDVVGCFGDESNTEDEPYCLEALFDALNEYAPPYAYFGAHEGDGADYGFWLAWDSLDEACHDGSIYRTDAGDEWPDPLPEGTEYVLEVTDHGNATLYAPDHTEVWSVV